MTHERDAGRQYFACAVAQSEAHRQNTVLNLKTRDLDMGRRKLFTLQYDSRHHGGLVLGRVCARPRLIASVADRSERLYRLIELSRPFLPPRLDLVQEPVDIRGRGLRLK